MKFKSITLRMKAEVRCLRLDLTQMELELALHLLKIIKVGEKVLQPLKLKTRKRQKRRLRKRRKWT